jgi:YaiO family outer membrane protein
VGRRIGGGHALTATGEWAERFDRTDVYFQARYDRRLPAGSVYVAVGGTPGADFRPEVAVLGGFDFPLGGAASATRLTADAAWARYPAGDVRSLSPGLAHSFGGGAVVVSARWVNVLDEQDDYLTGYALGGLVALTPRLRLRGGWADAPESSEGFTVRVRAVTAGVEYDLTDRLTVRLDAGHEDRGAYDRTFVGVASALRF